MGVGREPVQSLCAQPADRFAAYTLPHRLWRAVPMMMMMMIAVFVELLGVPEHISSGRHQVHTPIHVMPEERSASPFYSILY